MIRAVAVILPLSLIACSGIAKPPMSGLPFEITELARLNDPWAMTFLPDGRALITEKGGTIKLWQGGKLGQSGKLSVVRGTPKVAVGGQGGLGDIVAHPEFASNSLVYLSWIEQGSGGKGAVVGRAKLSQAALADLQVIWRQSPKTSGSGHFGHRIAFGPDGKLYISSGDRQKFDPAQDMAGNLGKIVRLNDDGSVPADNPFAASGGVTAQIWSLGHRNPLGLSFDGDRRLWEVEMGPQGGDEVNLITRGANYGWPRASNGSHYDGRDIPDHKPGDGYTAPKVWWNPSISPGGMIIYSGALFAQWKGDAFIAALGGTALIRVDLAGVKASKGDEWPMNARIRDVEQAPDGAIWLLEDGANARLLRLIPKG